MSPGVVIRGDDVWEWARPQSAETAVVSTGVVIWRDGVWEWAGRSAETAVVASAYVCGANRVWVGYLVIQD